MPIIQQVAILSGSLSHTGSICGPQVTTVPTAPYYHLQLLYPLMSPAWAYWHWSWQATASKRAEVEKKENRNSGHRKVLKKCSGVPVVAWQKRIQLVTMRLQLRSLASLSELRIWHHRELWCSSQGSSDPVLLWLWLAAVALIQPLAWELPYVAGPKKKKKMLLLLYLSFYYLAHYRFNRINYIREIPSPLLVYITSILFLINYLHIKENDLF